MESFEAVESNWISVNVYDKYGVVLTEFPWDQVPLQHYPLEMMGSPEKQNVKGRLTVNAYRSNDKWQVTIYRYDTNGRVKSKYILTQDVAEITQIGYKYDLQGQVTNRVVRYGGERFYHYNEYTELGQLKKVYTAAENQQPDTGSVAYAYNPTGTVNDVRYSEQSGGSYHIAIPFAYDLRDRLTDIDNFDSPTIPFAARYHYTHNGNIDTVKFYNNNGATQMSGREISRYDFEYDSIDRLLQADYSYRIAASGPWINIPAYDVENLSYDPNSNILTLRRNQIGSPTTIDDLTYQYNNSNNQLTDLLDNGVSHPDTAWDAKDSNYEYDANGNVTLVRENGNIRFDQFEYDTRNLLEQLRNNHPNTFTVTYRYNAAGQRIYKNLSTENEPEYYILDDDQILGVIKGDILLNWNIWGNGIIGRVEKNAVNLDHFYYLQDHLGSTRVVVNDTGMVMEAYDYYPFGIKMPGRIFLSGTDITKNLFTGKERDKETNWDYFGARYYHPAIGRFLAVDPLSDEVLSKTPYHYTSNNPINRFDPDGQLDFDKALSIVRNNVEVSVGTGIGVGGSLEVPFVGAIGGDLSLFSIDVMSNLSGNLKGEGKVISGSFGLNVLETNIVNVEGTVAQGAITSEGNAQGNLLTGEFKSDFKKDTGNVTEKKRMKVSTKNGKVKTDKRFTKKGNLGVSAKVGVLNAGIKINIRGIISEIINQIEDSKSSQKSNGSTSDSSNEENED